ncbi:MAG: fibronectin type III domain-containing protein [Flavobacteriaceae bacterium]
MKKYYLLSILTVFILMFSSCSKEDEVEEIVIINVDRPDKPPSNFDVYSENTKYNSTTLRWTESINPDDPIDGIIKYSVFFEGQEIHTNLDVLTVDIDNLTELTNYSGYVRAIDERGNTTDSNFQFSTTKYFFTFVNETEFDINHNPEPHEVLILDDGYIFSGTTNLTSSGYKAFFTEKIDKNGNTVWYKKYDINVGHGFPEMKKTMDGGFILMGGYILMKIDQNGNLLWHTEFACGSQNNCEINTVTETSNGDFIVGGLKSNEWSVAQLTDITTNAYLIRTNSTGQVIWEKIFGERWAQSIHDLINNQDGTYSFFGSIERGTITADNFSNETWVDNFWYGIIDEDGDLIHEKSYPENTFDIPRKMIKSSDGNFVFVGQVLGAYNASRSKIYKIDPQGDVIWSNEFYRGSEDMIRSVTEDNQGNFYTIGQITSGSFGEMGIYKFSSFGSELWSVFYLQNSFDTDTHGYDLKYVEEDGGLILATVYTWKVLFPPRTFKRYIKTDPFGSFEGIDSLLLND